MKRKNFKPSYLSGALFSLLATALLTVGLTLPPAAIAAPRVVQNIDVVYLYVGMQQNQPLPESFIREERIKLEGNYQRYTSAIYQKDKNRIHFVPKRVGSSVMVLKNKKNQIIGRLHIEVQKANLHKIAAELRDLLITVDGIEVKIYNKRVIIDGQVRLPREMARIQTVIAQYPGLVSSIVTYSPEAQKIVAGIIEEEIKSPEVTVRYAYNRFLLEGCVDSPEELKKAKSIADLYTQFEVSNVKGVSRKNLSPVKVQLLIPCESTKKSKMEAKKKKKKDDIPKLIQIVVHFVEMEKDFGKSFLFQWTPVIGDNGTQITSNFGNAPEAASGFTAALQTTVSNFFPKLNWAKSFGFARVLHNSSLLVADKERGTIQIETSSSTPTAEGTFEQMQSTISTNVTPEITGERKNIVQMQVGIQVASPASSGGGAVTSRIIDTKLHVRDGASAAIGGLISSILRRGYNKKPKTSVNATPIFNLYSQKEYETKKSQFVVFITPMIKSSSSIGVERIKKKFKLDE